MAVSADEYKKALLALQEALDLFNKAKIDEPAKKAFRDAAIQRFEYCVELAWKLAKKSMGSSSTAPRMIIREMAQNKLIDDPTIWFSFLEARNKTSHTYDEKVAEEVFIEIVKFLPEAKLLQKKF